MFFYKRITNIKLVTILSIIALSIFFLILIFPSASFAIENAKDCVNPKHYGVEHASDIKDKPHNGKINEECYTKEEREERIKEEYEEWKKAVKEANEEYTKKYNAYSESLKELISISAEIEAQDALISEKQEKLNKAITASYKQNYAGSLIVSLLLDEDMTQTLNKKKYMDSTIEYMKSVASEVRVEREKKQKILDEVNSHINKAKEEVIDSALHINDKIPDVSQEVKDKIDTTEGEDYKGNRKLADKNLSSDWTIDVALYYVGIPYVWGGKDEKGCDCSGFTQMVYRVANSEEIGVNTSSQYENMQRIEKNKLERGCVLFMDNPSNISQQHVAIFMENSTYIHNSGTGTLSRVDKGIDYFTCGLKVKDKTASDTA